MDSWIIRQRLFFINFCFGRQFPKVYRWVLEYHSYFVDIFLLELLFYRVCKKYKIYPLKPCVMVSIFDDIVSESHIVQNTYEYCLKSFVTDCASPTSCRCCTYTVVLLISLTREEH